MKKISFILVLCIFLSFGVNIIASAEEYTVTPRFANVNCADFLFTISDDVANIHIRVEGYVGVTYHISVKATLEKRALLGLWWSEVEEWNQSVDKVSETFIFTKNVGSGTYRCTFEVTVYGIDGPADVITKEITVEN